MPCRWPVATGTDGEMRFCAEPMDRNAAVGFRCSVSYCTAHLARAYVPRRQSLARDDDWTKRLRAAVDARGAEGTGERECEEPRELEFGGA